MFDFKKGLEERRAKQKSKKDSKIEKKQCLS